MKKLWVNKLAYYHWIHFILTWHWVYWVFVYVFLKICYNLTLIKLIKLKSTLKIYRLTHFQTHYSFEKLFGVDLKLPYFQPPLSLYQIFNFTSFTKFEIIHFFNFFFLVLQSSYSLSKSTCITEVHINSLLLLLWYYYCNPLFSITSNCNFHLSLSV